METVTEMSLRLNHCSHCGCFIMDDDEKVSGTFGLAHKRCSDSYKKHVNAVKAKKKK